MQPLPHLEELIRTAFHARDAAHPGGVWLASYFERAATRGRRRSDLLPELIFPGGSRGDLRPEAIAAAFEPATYRRSAGSRPLLPRADREWLAEAALSLRRGGDPALLWPLLGAVAEIEDVSHTVVGANASRAVVRQVLHGIGRRGLQAEPFAALAVRVLKIAQVVYVGWRLSGPDHEAAWAAVLDRLWSPHPTGRAGESAPWLPTLALAASSNARRRLRNLARARRTAEHSRALLARFVSGAGTQVWPWRAGAGRLIPESDGALSTETAGHCFFVLLTRAANERRNRVGALGGPGPVFSAAGFGAPEWLPDRTDDLAIRLLTASAPEVIPQPDRLDALALLVRATLSRASDPGRVAHGLQRLGVDVAHAEAPAMLHGARERLPGMLRWLEENGRDFLEAG